MATCTNVLIDKIVQLSLDLVTQTVFGCDSEEKVKCGDICLWFELAVHP